MSTYSRRFGRQYATPLGAGFDALAGAFVGNNANRQMLQLRAESLGTRNLANELLAEDRSYDLQQKIKAEANRQKALQYIENHPSDFGKNIVTGINLDPSHPENLFKASKEATAVTEHAEAIKMMRDRIKNDPTRAGQFTNDLISALYGKPSVMATALATGAKEADRSSGLESFDKSNAMVDLGYVDDKGKALNVPIGQALRVNPNFGQIASGSLAPSVKATNKAQKEKFESKTALNKVQTESIDKVQKALAGVTYPLKNEKDEIIANVPLSEIYTGDPKAFAELLATNPKVAKVVNESLKAKWDQKTSQHKETWERLTLDDRVDKEFWETQSAESVALLRDLELDLKQWTFNAEANKKYFDAYESKMKAFIKNVEATQGKVMNFERQDNGDLVARGTNADGVPFQKIVAMGDVLRIPKGKVVLSGKDNGTISYQSFNKEGEPTLKPIGDRGGISRATKIKNSKQELLKMIEIAQKYPDQITGGKGALEEAKEYIMAIFNMPAVNAKGKAVDYKRQFTSMGNRILLSIAPFILSSTGSKISDKDMERIDKAFKRGSLSTNITEVFETLQAMGRALEAVDKKETTQDIDDPDVEFASNLTRKQAQLLLGEHEKNPKANFLTKKQIEILQTMISESGG